MSEINTGQPEAERQLSLAERARRGTAIALAGILPIAFPVLHEEEVVWEETVTEEVVITGTTGIQTFTLSDTEIQDENGDEIPEDELADYLTFRLTETDEKDEFVDAVKRIVEPDSEVLISREDDNIVIRTDDFAEHPELEPKDKQAQTLEIGIDGKFVHGERIESQQIKNPDEIIQVETTKEHRVPYPVLFYPLAVMPEKPQIVDEGEEDDNDDPVEPDNSNDSADTPSSPEDDTYIPGKPEETEPEPTQEPGRTSPNDPDQSGKPGGNNPDPTDKEQPKKTETSGSGGTENTQSSNTGPSSREIYDEYIRQTSAPRGTSARNPRIRSGSGGREPRSFDFSSRFPKIRDLFIPFITGSIILGGAFAWRQSEFESIEDCELSTPEQPFNIEKESGKWFPEFSRPDCPEPDGHEVTISFDGFEDGYGLGWLSKNGNVIGVVSVPKSAMPDSAVNHFAGDEFTSQVRSLLSRVDQARQQIANQTGQDHNSFDMQY